MTLENIKKPISTVCEIDPQQKLFLDKVKDYADSKLDEPGLMKFYPDYLLPVEKRLFKRVLGVATGFYRKIKG